MISELLLDDHHYVYPGYFDHEAWCKLRVLRRQDGTIVAVASDPDVEDSGTSITNAAEMLATQIWREQGEPRQFIFIEHYPANRYGGKEPETFAQTIFQLGSDGRYKLVNPGWSHLDRAGAELIAGAELL